MYFAYIYIYIYRGRIHINCYLLRCIYTLLSRIFIRCSCTETSMKRWQWSRLSGGEWYADVYDRHSVTRTFVCICVTEDPLRTSLTREQKSDYPSCVSWLGISRVQCETHSRIPLFSFAHLRASVSCAPKISFPLSLTSCLLFPLCFNYPRGNAITPASSRTCITDPQFTVSLFSLISQANFRYENRES